MGVCTAIKRWDCVVQSQRRIVAEQCRYDNLSNRLRVPTIHSAGFCCQSQPARTVRWYSACWDMFGVVRQWPYMALLRLDSVLVLRVFQSESCFFSTVQAKSFFRCCNLVSVGLKHLGWQIWALKHNTTDVQDKKLSFSFISRTTD